MAKAANQYLDIDPWVLMEQGFHPEHGRVSESIFALSNEYMGIRGYFDEGYGDQPLIGSYLNSVFEEQQIQHPVAWKGMSTRNTFMVNSVDWVHTRISVDGERLDLASSRFSDFTRRIDMRTGVLIRAFIWHTAGGKSLKLTFTRFVSMESANLGGQRITIEPLNFSGTVEMVLGLDFSTIHENVGRCLWTPVHAEHTGETYAMLATTEKSRHRIFSAFQLHADTALRTETVAEEKFIGVRFSLPVQQGVATTVEKMVVNYAEKHPEVATDVVWAAGQAIAAQHTTRAFDEACVKHCAYWTDVWEKLDVTIEGDPENQQGIRFCIFQLHQTYHGEHPELNIGAKGLTGEDYDGATFWDSETYCLPFYLFNNPQAAKNLLYYRYTTLPQALERAVVQDCRGACYPFITIDGTESCGVWQHGNLEVHVTAAVAYGIWHYLKICDDKEFLYREGIEMLLQISRYFASRGGWNSRTGEFGLWGVMGADEFHMMVHNNCYTNVMVKKSFEYTLSVMEEMQRTAPALLAAAREKVSLDGNEPADWQMMAEKMRIPQDRTTGIYEQHDGYFDLPHIDLASLDQFPIYKYWAYDRIFRYDMIKQPDVLLLPFFFSQEYPLEEKRANYEYYEARCIHESSLSPSIHSILAAELGKHEQAYNYFNYATRLDLDDYNRNTDRGLHTTSLAAAWMNIVFGFGGMRTDGDTLTFNPSLPQVWQSFSFRILYRGSILSMKVDQETVTLKTISGESVPVEVFGNAYLVNAEGVSLALPAARKGHVAIEA